MSESEEVEIAINIHWFLKVSSFIHFKLLHSEGMHILPFWVCVRWILSPNVDTGEKELQAFLKSIILEQVRFYIITERNHN